MIGNRIRIVLVAFGSRQEAVTGTLHKLDQRGATIWREHAFAEGQGISFIPMHRIHEIIDLGRV